MKITILHFEGKHLTKLESRSKKDFTTNIDSFSELDRLVRWK